MAYKPTAGAYRITHKPTGRFYIGSSGSHKCRLNEHRRDLEAGKHHSKRLQSVFTKWEDLEIEVIETKTLKEARELEQVLLDRSIVLDLCCNTALSSLDPTLGVITPEMRRENAAKAITAWTGSKHTQETRLKLAELANRNPRDEETKLKIGLSKSRKVSVGGQVYDSATTLANELGISIRTVRTRLYSDSPRFKDWIFVEPHDSSILKL